VFYTFRKSLDHIWNHLFGKHSPCELELSVRMQQPPLPYTRGIYVRGMSAENGEDGAAPLVVTKWGHKECCMLHRRPYLDLPIISFRHIPAIATENLLMLFFSLFTICFSPFGPSSSETQFITYVSRESCRYYNGSVVHNLSLLIYLYEGKCAILKWIDYNFFK
jgi:hypothetical protein